MIFNLIEALCSNIKTLLFCVTYFEIVMFHPWNEHQWIQFQYWSIRNYWRPVGFPLHSFTLVCIGRHCSGFAASLSVSGRIQPASALSQRGVSYPPPTLRGLTRTMPVPQSRNPPLVKSRHLVSVAGVATAAANDTSPACLVEAAYSSSNNEQTILPSKIFFPFLLIFLLFYNQGIFFLFCHLFKTISLESWMAPVLIWISNFLFRYL